MATIKTTYITYSCPKCKRQLYKAAAGSVDIGNPVLTCPKCQLSFRNPMKDEWFNYDKKVQAFLIPVLLPILMGGVMWLLTVIGDSGLEGDVMFVIGAAIGLIIGVVMVIMNLVKMLQSKKRMKSRSHLVKLLTMNIISMREFEALEKQADRD